MRKATLLFIILLAASIMAQTASTTTTFLLTFAGATFTAPVRPWLAGGFRGCPPGNTQGRSHQQLPQA